MSFFQTFHEFSQDIVGKLYYPLSSMSHNYMGVIVSCAIQPLIFVYSNTFLIFYPAGSIRT